MTYYMSFIVNQKPSAETILVQVCSFFEVEPADIKGKSRKRNLADIRKVYCKVCAGFRISQAKTGSVINRNHATARDAALKALEIPETKLMYHKFIKHLNYDKQMEHLPKHRHIACDAKIYQKAVNHSLFYDKHTQTR